MKVTHDATGEVLLVTGGASGIGDAVARAFAAAGGTSVVFDVADPADSDQVERLERVRVDVSVQSRVRTEVDAVVARHGRIDGLVAAAAVQPRIPVAELPPGVWRQALSVNLDGVVWACQAVLPHMVRQRRGSIVVFGSGLGRVGRAEASTYAASKGALIPFAKSLAAEVAGSRVRVNAIFPGVIDTAQFRAANPEGPELEHWKATIGVGEVEDVVGPLMFLLSDEASMTGSVLSRDQAYRRTEI